VMVHAVRRRRRLSEADLSDHAGEESDEDDADDNDNDDDDENDDDSESDEDMGDLTDESEQRHGRGSGKRRVSTSTDCGSDWQSLSSYVCEHGR
jgi:hypothetical protein